MDLSTGYIIAIAIFAISGISLLLFLYFYLTGSSSSTQFESLLNTGRNTNLGSAREERGRLEKDDSGEEFERIKEMTKKQSKVKAEQTLTTRFYQAGMYSPKEQADFRRLQLMVPVVTCLLFTALTFHFAGSSFVFYGVIIGLLLGMVIPGKILDKRVKSRSDEILYYLPLVIEQIAIGVSSSLDVGPCLQRVVSMADERDSHNVVTELLRHVEYHVKSGSSLEDALLEVGVNSGNVELKHSFMALAQVAKHGGEISRQLQELADAVSNQRETVIDGMIKKLELKATGPVALVFLGFLLILFSGFFMQIKNAL